MASFVLMAALAAAPLVALFAPWRRIWLLLPLALLPVLGFEAEGPVGPASAWGLFFLLLCVTVAWGFVLRQCLGWAGGGRRATVAAGAAALAPVGVLVVLALESAVRV